MHNSACLLASDTNTSNTTTELKTTFYQGRNLVAERQRTLSQDTTNYVHSDHLGSPVARTNTAGCAYERTTYEVYGLKSNSAPNPPYGTGLFPDGIGFAGHRVDRVSGLSYMQQRYYDPVAGRFISPDPVPADAGALFNRYAYANNNPVTLVDTDGRAAQTAFLAFPPAWPYIAGATIMSGAVAILSQPVTPAEAEQIYAATEIAVKTFVPGGKFFGELKSFVEVEARKHEASKPLSPKATADTAGTPPGGPDDDGDDSVLFTHKKHHPKSNAPEPANARQLYASSIRDSENRRWAKDSGGNIHRFSKPSNGQRHWNGSTKPNRDGSRIRFEDIPIEIREVFGRLR